MEDAPPLPPTTPAGPWTVRQVADHMWNGDWKDQLPIRPHFPTTDMEVLEPGMAFMLAYANIVAFTTDAGPVLVDASSFDFSERLIKSLEPIQALPIHTIILTHGHLDHAMGILGIERLYKAAKRPLPRVVGHANIADRFERYTLTATLNTTVNTRQFANVRQFSRKYPKVHEIYHDKLVLHVGGVEFQLYHDKGETDDHTWVYVPRHNAICPGDLFTNVMPNCGNPQKVQRYPREWSAALKKMLALNASILLPGHGPPIFGADRVRLVLSDTAALLDSLVDQTLTAMEAGLSLDRVLQAVRLPTDLLSRPYLRPVYDDPMFIVQNIWRRYSGWWDGHVSHLKPVPHTALARELMALTGGAAPVAARARALLDAGDADMALALVQLAVDATADDSAEAAPLHALRATVLRAKEQQETSLMARNIYGSFRKTSDRLAGATPAPPPPPSDLPKL